MTQQHGCQYQNTTGHRGTGDRAEPKPCPNACVQAEDWRQTMTLIRRWLMAPACSQPYCITGPFPCETPSATPNKGQGSKAGATSSQSRHLERALQSHDTRDKGVLFIRASFATQLL